MSNGKTHDKFTNQLKLPISILLGILVYPIVGWIGSVVAVVCCWLGFQLQRIMTPDLDVDGGFYGFFLARKIPVLGSTWEYYWKFYAIAVPHRSKLSHLPVLSTIARFVYILPLLFPFWWSFLVVWDWWAYLLIGMILADCGHIILDYILWFRYWYEKHFRM